MNRCKHELIPDQCAMCAGTVTAVNQTRNYGEVEPGQRGGIIEDSCKSARLDDLDDFAKSDRNTRLKKVKERQMLQRDIDKNELWDIIQAEFQEEEFTSNDLMKVLGIENDQLSEKQLKVIRPLRMLRECGLIEEIGQVGPAKLYRIREQKEADGVVDDEKLELMIVEDESVNSIPLCRDCGEPAKMRKDGLSTGFCPDHLSVRSRRAKSTQKDNELYKVVVDFKDHVWLYDAIIDESDQELRTIEKQIIFTLRDLLTLGKKGDIGS